MLLLIDAMRPTSNTNSQTQNLHKNRLMRSIYCVTRYAQRREGERQRRGEREAGGGGRERERERERENQTLFTKVNDKRT